MYSTLQTLFHSWRTLWRRPGPALPDPEEATPAAPPPLAESDEPAEAPVPFEVESARMAEARRLLEETLQRPVPAAPEEIAWVAAPGDAAAQARRARTLEALSGLKQLPALQTLAKSFIRAAARDDVDLGEVAAAIAKDPALSVRVLQMANAAAHGHALPADDLGAAVLRLGVVRVRWLSQAIYMLRESRTSAPGYDWRHLWIHALATATIAEEIGRRLGLPADPLLGLAALLHDVGKIVLSVVCPEDYGAALLAAWNQARPLDELERVQLGVSHREAGEVFLEQCGLPPVVVAAAVHHHAPAGAPEAAQPTVAVIALANHLSKAFGLGFSGTVAAGDEVDFTELEAWATLEGATGRTFDRLLLEDGLRRWIPQLRTELGRLGGAADDRPPPTAPGEIPVSRIT